MLLKCAIFFLLSIFFIDLAHKLAIFFTEDSRSAMLISEPVNDAAVTQLSSDGLKAASIDRSSQTG